MAGWSGVVLTTVRISRYRNINYEGCLILNLARLRQGSGSHSHIIRSRLVQVVGGEQNSRSVFRSEI